MVLDAVTMMPVQSENGETSYSMTHTVTSSGKNRLLVCIVASKGRGGKVDLSLTANGVPMTATPGAVHADYFDTRLQMFHLTDPAAGANRVVIAATGNRPIVVLSRCLSYTGANQSTPFVNAAKAGGIGRNAAVTVTSKNGHAVIGAMQSCSTHPDDVIATGSEWAALYVGGNDCQASFQRRAGAGSVTLDWSINFAPEWIAIGASLQPAR